MENKPLEKNPGRWTFELRPWHVWAVIGLMWVWAYWPLVLSGWYALLSYKVGILIVDALLLGAYFWIQYEA